MCECSIQKDFQASQPAKEIILTGPEIVDIDYCKTLYHGSFLLGYQALMDVLLDFMGKKSLLDVTGLQKSCWTCISLNLAHNMKGSRTIQLLSGGRQG